MSLEISILEHISLRKLTIDAAFAAVSEKSTAFRSEDRKIDNFAWGQFRKFGPQGLDYRYNKKLHFIRGILSRKT